MNKRDRGKVLPKVLGISLMVLVVCVCVYINEIQTCIRYRAQTVLNMPTVTIRYSDIQNDLDDLDFSLNPSNQTIIVMNTTTEAESVRRDEYKTDSPNRSMFINGIPNTTDKLYQMIGLFTGRQPSTLQPETVTTNYKIPEPFTNGRPAFVRIYEESDVYDKYGLWKVGDITSETDTLMKVIHESLVDQNDEDEEVIWPPTLWPVTDVVNVSDSKMESVLDKSNS